MPVSRKLRFVAVLGLAGLLMGAGCRSGDDTDDDVAVTEAPSPTPSIEAVGDFQLVGRIDEAFVGQDPDVEIGPVERELDVDEPSPTPAGTPAGEAAPRGGILRIEIEDLTEDLTDACGVDADDVVEVFWTTQTFFEPATVLDDFADLEDDIEDRTAGISGSAFRSPDAEEGPELELTPPAPTAGGTGATGATPSPGADTTPVDTDCILVADQIGFTITTLPTPRPVARRTAAPAPAPVRTATPTPVVTRTPTATRTAAPTATAPPATAATASP